MSIWDFMGLDGTAWAVKCAFFTFAKGVVNPFQGTSTTRVAPTPWPRCTFTKAATKRALTLLFFPQKEVFPSSATKELSASFLLFGQKNAQGDAQGNAQGNA